MVGCNPRPVYTPCLFVIVCNLVAFICNFWNNVELKKGPHQKSFCWHRTTLIKATTKFCRNSNSNISYPSILCFFSINAWNFKIRIINLVTAQYGYCKFSLTDTGVAAVHASGFTFSVHPRLHVFHETPTMQTHTQCITYPVAHLQLERESVASWSHSSRHTSLSRISGLQMPHTKRTKQNTPPRRIQAFYPTVNGPAYD